MAKIGQTQIHYDLDAYPEDEWMYQLKPNEVAAMWNRIRQIWGDRGLPSCGLTDAGVLGTGDTETVFLGGKETEPR